MVSRRFLMLLAALLCGIGAAADNVEGAVYRITGDAAQEAGIRVIGASVTRWKEREGHRLKRSMITGVYDKDLDVLVLGIGVEARIEVPDKVKRDVLEHGIPELLIEPTPDACRTYNRLHRDGKRVALLAHGTC